MRTYTHNYPSDITREQFEIIRSDLESARKVTKPRKVDLYSIFCGVLYLLKSGCQWDMIPADYPNRSTIRNYYDIWSKTSRNGTRRLWKNCERMLHNSLQMLILAFIAIILKRF
jgi:transposase